jgi:hypothetical protein
MTKQNFLNTLQNNTIYYIGSRFVRQENKELFIDQLKQLPVQELELTDKDKRQVTKIGSNHIIFNNNIWLHFDANKNTFLELDNDILLYIAEYHDSDKINCVIYLKK